MFGGVEIIAVDAGTEIEHQGEKLVVTETNAVFLGSKVYMTHKHTAALRDHSQIRASQKKVD